MYDPVQIPYILNKEFPKNIQYAEEPADLCSEFVICFWEMTPLANGSASTDNVIVADGCIDLVVAYDEKQIDFAGMRKTNFHYKLELPGRFMGARLKPGAFNQLTGFPGTAAMDILLPIAQADKNFDAKTFFSLSFEESKAFFKYYIGSLIQGKRPDRFTTLFDELCDDPLLTTAELYELLHFSPRQCQRLFMKHFGLTPQMVLSIIRFQRCLKILTAGDVKPSDVLETAAYYDQSHLIKDFKRNIGITPLDLIKRYTT